MEVLTLFAKAALAVLLVTAGAAKLADIGRFAATMRLFLPAQAPDSVIRTCALAVAFGELALGTVSLSWQPAAWPNLAVLALACSFVAVSAVGYAFYRGRSCNCFGALSQRRFDIPGVIRSAVIGAVAAIPVFGVQPAHQQAWGPGLPLLAAGAALLAYVSFTAAKVIGLMTQTMRG